MQNRLILRSGTVGIEVCSRYVVMPSGVRYDLMPPAERVRKPADLARKRRQPRRRIVQSSTENRLSWT